tara:strand:+ start:162 stop:479 length:318 start_codon:yes stop_codon:yes gene_type:complete
LYIYYKINKGEKVMSDTQKFTDAELAKITELRDANALKINEFGQLELEILLTNQRVETLKTAKEDLQNQYVALQEQERGLVKELNEKYGTGTVDIESGEFIPNNG